MIVVFLYVFGKRNRKVREYKTYFPLIGKKKKNLKDRNEIFIGKETIILCVYFFFFFGGVVTLILC